jgi:antitoxin component of MazEF toxin-antitoxin module
MSVAKRQEQYEGTVVQVGNSRGMRMPAGFFNAHPEFNGKVRMTVVGNGHVLVSAAAPARRKAKHDDSDPVMDSFLRFLDRQMTENPQDIVAADTNQLRRIANLVKGVRVK